MGCQAYHFEVSPADVTYRWDFDDGTDIVIIQGNDTAYHTYTTYVFDGIYGGAHNDIRGSQAQK